MTKTQKKLATFWVLVALILIFRKSKNTTSRNANISVFQDNNPVSGTIAPVQNKKNELLPKQEQTIAGTESTGDSLTDTKVKSFYIRKTNEVGSVEIYTTSGAAYVLEFLNESQSFGGSTANYDGYFVPKIKAINGAKYKFSAILH